jgi:hypothetical protein
MHKSLLSVSVLFPAIVFLLTACAGYQHVSSPQFVPFNSKKGQLSTAVSPNLIQGGYAFHDHFSVFGSAFKRDTEDKFFDFGGKEGGGADQFQEHSREFYGGASYFNTYGLSSYEFAVGSGGGRLSYHHFKDEITNEDFRLEALKKTAFVQASYSIGLSTKVGTFLKVGPFVKIASYQYHDIKVTNTFSDHDLYKEDRFFINKKSALVNFIDPGFVIRGGSKWIQGRMTLSTPIDVARTGIRFRNFNLSYSLFVTIQVLKSRESK